MFGLTQWSISLTSVKILTRKEQMAVLQMSGGKQARKPTGLKKGKLWRSPPNSQSSFRICEDVSD